MSDDAPLQARQMAQLNTAVEKVLAGVMRDVAARRQVVELVLKAGFEIKNKEHLQEILEELERFIYRPALELPPIEVKLV